MLQLKNSMNDGRTTYVFRLHRPTWTFDYNIFNQIIQFCNASRLISCHMLHIFQNKGSLWSGRQWKAVSVYYAAFLKFVVFFRMLVWKNEHFEDHGIVDKSEVISCNIYFSQMSAVVCLITCILLCIIIVYKASFIHWWHGNTMLSSMFFNALSYPLWSKQAKRLYKS